jgi:Domain of unknown function (DUF5666)
MRRGFPWVAAVAALFFASETLAQSAPPPTRIRGTIEKLDGQVLTVKTREGKSEQIKLADNFSVTGVVKASLADIQAGKFVGIAGLPQRDGSQKALEVLVFPDAMRGTGEGHYPWDLQPESTMTNADIADVVKGVSGPVLTLKYKDGEKKIVVPPEAPIVTFEAGDKSLLMPGVGVMVPAARQPDGSLVASRVLAGKNGVVPPM